MPENTTSLYPAPASTASSFRIFSSLRLRIAARARDDAVGAAAVAAVLYFHKRARVAFKTLQRQLFKSFALFVGGAMSTMRSCVCKNESTFSSTRRRPFAPITMSASATAAASSGKACG